MICKADYHAFQVSDTTYIVGIGFNPSLHWTNILKKVSVTNDLATFKLECHEPKQASKLIPTPFFVVNKLIQYKEKKVVVEDSEGKKEIQILEVPPSGRDNAGYDYGAAQNKTVHEHEDKVSQFMADMRDHPEFHQSLYPAFSSFDCGQLPPDNPEDEIREYVWRFLSDSRDYDIWRIGLPKCVKLEGWTLRCANHEHRFWIRVSYPTIDEIWEDVVDCIKVALIAAGGAAVISGGGAAWAAFVAAFKACVIAKFGDWADHIRLSLHDKSTCGPWGKC